MMPPISYHKQIITQKIYQTRIMLKRTHTIHLFLQIKQFLIQKIIITLQTIS